MEPALNRFHPGMIVARYPAPTALPFTADGRNFDRMREQEQAVPFDFSYTITIEGRYRGTGDSKGQSAQVLPLLMHVMRHYQPQTHVRVRDSLDDPRTYRAEMSGVSTEDEVFEVSDRTIGFSMSLRVEGELDLNAPVEYFTVQQVDATVGEYP